MTPQHFSLYDWRAYFSYILGRPVSLAETITLLSEMETPVGNV